MLIPDTRFRCILESVRFPSNRTELDSEQSLFPSSREERTEQSGESSRKPRCLFTIVAVPIIHSRARDLETDHHARTKRAAKARIK